MSQDAIEAPASEEVCSSKFLRSLAEFFDQALLSEADLIVIMARRAFALYHLLRLAGMLSISERDLEGRVVSQRAIERDPDLAHEKSVLLVDDTAVKYGTLCRYSTRLWRAKPRELSVLVFIACEPSDDVRSELSSCGIGPIEGTHIDKATAQEITEFNGQAMEAITRTGYPFFVDFPVYHIQQRSISMWLSRLVCMGWEVRHLSWPDGEGPTVYVCAEMENGRPTGFRLRLVEHREEGGPCYLVAKYPGADSVSLDEQTTRATAESIRRDQLFEQSADELRSLLPSLGAGLVASSNIRLDPQVVRDHWPPEMWHGILDSNEISLDVQLLNASLAADDGLTARANIPAVDRKNVELVHSCLLGSETAPGPLKQLSDQGDGFLISELASLVLTECPALTRADVQFAVDFLSDRCILTPRVRIRDKEVVRIWTAGESSSDVRDGDLGFVNRRNPGYFDQVVDLWIDYQSGFHTKEAATNLGISAQKLGQMAVRGSVLSVLDRTGNWWFPEDLELSLDPEVLERLHDATPYKHRYSARRFLWMTTSRGALRGRSPIEAASNKGEAIVLELLRAELV